MFACNVLCWLAKQIIKFLPLFCPEGTSATSLSESESRRIGHLRFWPRELEGRVEEDGERESLSEGDSWATLPPAPSEPDLVAWWQRSLGVTALSVSLSLADGIVALFGRPFMLSVVIAKFISVVEHSIREQAQTQNIFCITNTLSK